jgi:hypothetical protein
MTLEQALVEKFKSLPAEKQRQLLDFAEFLEQKSIAQQPRRNILGLLADLSINVTADDIAEARREMWGNFPRNLDL